MESEAGYHSVAEETFDALCEALERIEDKFDGIDYGYSVCYKHVTIPLSGCNFSLARSTQHQDYRQGLLGYQQTDAQPTALVVFSDQVRLSTCPDVLIA